MDKDVNKSVVPPQREGGSANAEATTMLDSVEAASGFYKMARQRLLHVNEWQKWAGTAAARFQITDASGKAVIRPVQEGDYFKIDIPGPGPVAGDGFDWAHVEKVEETNAGDGEQTAIQVRPAADPAKSGEVAHFFDNSATSTFVVKRMGNAVSAAVHDRNLKPNMDTKNAVDKARNTAVATGAAAAFSKLQWKSLVNGLVGKED